MTDGHPPDPAAWERLEALWRATVDPDGEGAETPPDTDREDLELREEMESLRACAPEAASFFRRLAGAVDVAARELGSAEFVKGVGLESFRTEFVARFAIEPDRHEPPVATREGSNARNKGEQLNREEPPALPADRYRIEAEIGRGGMAVVYRARDLRHDRDVAVKVMSREVSTALGVQRFLGEIRTTARLQHPHILALLDSGETEGRPWFVAPLVEGETLRDRLEREAQLDIGDAVAITTAVADALDYAHRHGVIHRDIKPENILLHEGRPVVADFGIALAVSAAADERMTGTGLSLGTPQYMSPEQATASRHITARTDIYSLASVLYEMLAGTPPHTGPTAQHILAEVATAAPRPVTEFRRTVPANVAAALSKALEKVPADRFASAKAFADALKDPAFGVTAASSTALENFPEFTAKTRAWRLATISSLILGVGGVGFGLWASRGHASSQTTRFMVKFPPGQEIQVGASPSFALSRDGSRLVYIGPDSSGAGQLWVRELSSLSGRPLPGTSGALGPRFSPDGESIVYHSGPYHSGAWGGDLRVVSVHGGAPEVLAHDSVWGWSAEWCDDGYIYFDRNNLRPARVSARGGPIEDLSRPHVTPPVWVAEWLSCLPAQGLMVVQFYRGGATADAAGLVDTRSGAVSLLVPDQYARYVRPGDLFRVTDAGDVYRVPVDLGRRPPTVGEPRLVAEGLLLDNYFGSAQFDASYNGEVLAYMVSAGARASRQLVWLDRTGRATPFDSTWQGQFVSPTISPDGSRIAVMMYASGAWRVAIRNLDGGAITNIVSRGESIRYPAWTPDGRSVAFETIKSGDTEMNLVQQFVDGSAPADTLATDVGRNSNATAAEFLPDGKRFVMNFGYQIFMMSRSDSVRRLVTPGTSPAVSPKGKWVAFVSRETGHPEIFVKSLEAADPFRTQISVDGGVDPRWDPSGRSLYYLNKSGDLMEVRLSSGNTIVPQPPHRLFSTRGLLLDPIGHAYAVAADGRFLMIKAAGRAGDLVVEVNRAIIDRSH